MSTQSGPPNPSNLDLFADAICEVATNYQKSVLTNKPVANELAKHLKALKLLIALSDYEVKQLRSKK